MVYTSSIFSFFTCLNMAAYSVSKRGLEAFADCLRVEMASFGVKVYASDSVQLRAHVTFNCIVFPSSLLRSTCLVSS